MGLNCKTITNSIWKLIIFHHSRDKSIWNITKLVNLAHSTVQYVIKCFKEENQIENKVRKGWPRKWSKCNERFIIGKILKNPSLSAVKASAEFNEKFFTLISPEILRGVLREARLPEHWNETEGLGFHSKNQWQINQNVRV